MRTSQHGIDLIKKYEGCKLTAYRLSGEKFNTIGYGHYGSDVTDGMVITQARAEELLRDDLLKFESAVSKTDLDLTQNSFDALVSFAYNCGQGNLLRLVRNRTQKEIANTILAYNKSNGKVLSGLTKRRKEESELFISGIKPVSTVAKEVLDGLWDAGTRRKHRLVAAGYDYKEVQNEVNRIIAEDDE